MSSPIRVHIIPAQPDHAEAMEAVQRAAYSGSKPDDAADALHAEHFRSHIAIFLEAQFVAVEPSSGLVVGHTSGMLMDFDPEQPYLHSWLETTGGGYITTHKPDGQWMYGVESAVLPAYQGRGVGSQLMNARFDVVRRLNLRGMVAGSTIMDYHRVADTMTAEAYVAAVVAGTLVDTNLSKQLHKGFRVQNIIPNYVTDALSCGYGASIIWENEAYRGR